MKIGFYMAYAPYVKEFSLKKEGLGRYLSFLLKAFGDNGDEVVIACPRWCLSAVDELLEENNVSRDHIEFVVPKSDPAIYKIYMLLKRKIKAEKPRKKNKMKNATYKLFGRIVDSIFSTFSILKMVLILLTLSAIGIIFIPIIIILLFITLMYLVMKLFLLFLKRNSKKISLKSKLKQVIINNVILCFLYNMIREASLRQEFQEKIRYASSLEIIRKVNYMKKNPDIWYCHTAFWAEFCDIKGTKVVCVPDLVTAEFPFPFSRGEFTDVTEKVKRTIEKSQYFITYSDYLKNSLLINRFGKNDKNCFIIQHAQNNMLPYIDLSEYFSGKNFYGDVNECFVKDVLFKGLLNHMVCLDQYISDGVPLDVITLRDMKYIFYPSQARGNKNILTLLKAYKYLLREKSVQIKLFLTCDYRKDEELKQFIYEERLQYDILSFVNVSNQELASLYFGAQLVVNPTFYEGGFPFTFGEGMSVGVPSIMSNIPQNTEVLRKLDNEKYEQWLFDPTDPMELAEKISFGLQNIGDLYLKQKCIYDQLNQRTWKDVGNEYAEAFKTILEMNNKLD